MKYTQRNTLQIALSSFAALSSFVAYETCCLLESRLGRLILKPLLMPSVAAVYLSTAENVDKYPLLGFFFGWLGDIFLLFEGQAFFAAGLLAFLIGHLFYVVSLVQRRTKGVPIAWYAQYLVPTFIFGAIVAYNAVVGVGALKTDPHGVLTAGIALYSCVIGSMLVSALWLAASFPGDAKNFVRARHWARVGATGAVLFVISDGILGYSLFKQPFQYSTEILMLFYVSGQLLLALSMGKITRAKHVDALIKNK